MDSQIPKTMRAITLPPKPPHYTSPYPLSALTFHAAYQTPTPAPTQALIRIHATAITPYELTWPYPPSGNPRITCHDISGTIVSTPPSSAFAPGDEIICLLPYTLPGGMAEYVAVEPRFLALKPKNLEWTEAASLPRAALTALQAVQKLGGKAEGRVLVTGASGAVGRMVVQILRERKKDGKIVVVGGKGSDGLKALGADIVVDYRSTPAWEEGVGTVDAVVDCLGGEALEKSVKVIGDDGFVITIGSPPPVWGDLKGWKEASDKGVKGDFFIVEESGEELGEIAKLVQSGKLVSSVGLVVDGLTEEGVKEGWTRGLKGGLAGSVVVKIL